MGSLLQIRNVPDAERQALKARAAASGQSFNAYLLGLLTKEASRPTVAEVLARAAQRAEQIDGSTVDVVQGAREERDAELLRRLQP